MFLLLSPKLASLFCIRCKISSLLPAVVWIFDGRDNELSQLSPRRGSGNGKFHNGSSKRRHGVRKFPHGTGKFRSVEGKIQAEKGNFRADNSGGTTEKGRSTTELPESVTDLPFSLLVLPGSVWEFPFAVVALRGKSGVFPKTKPEPPVIGAEKIAGMDFAIGFLLGRAAGAVWACRFFSCCIPSESSWCRTCVRHTGNGVPWGVENHIMKKVKK